MKKKKLLSYDIEKWKTAFNQEKTNILFLLPNYKVNVEHIGATSVNNCRSFRNVDILVSTSNFADIYTIAMILGTKDYKELNELSDLNCRVLARRNKINGCGVTIRVVEYASLTYNRFISFKLYLNDSYEHVQKYNYFREALFEKTNHNISEYNKIKYDYINAVLDENYKFE